MYHIAICDNNREYVSYLKVILQEAGGERDVEFKTYEYSSGEELIYNLDRDIHYDLLILDVLQDIVNRDEIGQLFRKKYPYSVIVFCSEQLQLTIKSFKATPFRYFLKKQNRQDIVDTMKEIFDEIDRESNEPFIMCHYRRIKRKVKLKNILYIENSKRGGRIVVSPKCVETEFEEKLLTDKKPKDLYQDLKKFGFAQAQRAYLVNMNHIELLRAEDCVFDSGEILKTSRAYRKDFKEAFEKYFSNKYV